MCDYREGELILAYDEEDPSGRQLIERIDAGAVEHVTRIDDLHSRLERSGVKAELRMRVHLLRVPEGQEIWKINYLHQHYLELEKRSYGPLRTVPMIVPNSYLMLEGFNASTDYAAYKATLGSMHGATGRRVTVAVVDSGIESGSAMPAKITDLITAPNGTGADQVGHGTAVASVIHDVAPDASVEIVKVTDAQRLVEWDGLAGLATASSADVINLSMSFGSGTQVCAQCGRQSISSRSMVFEAIVGLTLQKPHEPILVAAAGNYAKAELRYPARFGDVVAVGAVDANGNRAAYSNCGAVDAAGQPHANLFFAPGGENARPVGTTTAPLPVRGHFGTSLATAYASAVVACARETRGVRAQILADLRAAATRLPNHVAAYDGIWFKAADAYFIAFRLSRRPAAACAAIPDRDGPTDSRPP